MEDRMLLKSAKDFADELTNYNVWEKGLHDPKSISKERRDNNKAAREKLLQRGVKPRPNPS